MKTREMICIVCPIGCRLMVEEKDGKIIVSGNQCKRGEKYAIEEVTAPRRPVTSIVPIKGGNVKMVSVKTSDSIPKELIFAALETLKGLVLEAPIKVGDIIVENVLNTGVDFISTKSVEKI
ncbi:MAG: DUF1667 domain-containing protein [Bacilli bacterium]|nr:DUF1667 domain-containing protein [Bacilli bacterium]